jgi:hypothetical protein
MRREVRADLVGGAGGHAVEHQRDDGAALAGGAQQRPGHGVGVAGRGGDEQPQVRGGQQLRGERPVAVDHRVDVRCVEVGQAGGQVVGGDECSEPGSVLGLDVRASPGSSWFSANHGESAGLQTRTGARVVGRSTPAGLTGARTRLLTSVDLPARWSRRPHTSSGASRRRRRGSR